MKQENLSKSQVKSIIDRTYLSIVRAIDSTVYDLDFDNLLRDCVKEERRHRESFSSDARRYSIPASWAGKYFACHYFLVGIAEIKKGNGKVDTWVLTRHHGYTLGLRLAALTLGAHDKTEGLLEELEQIDYCEDLAK